MDDADRAQDDDEKLTAATVAAIRARTADAVYIGQCLHCQAFTPKGVRWCDADCRDAWERERLFA